MIKRLYNIFSENNFSYSTDTRTLVLGDIFFALSGDNFNGNTFAQVAIEKGASHVVVDDVEFYTENDERYIKVDSVYDTLLALACYHRQQFSIPIITIAGSNGKTTTKEIAYAVLSTQYNVLATSNNNNNNLGVAHTLLAIRPDHELILIELGSNTPGELGQAIVLAQPTHGLVTNIGKEHLEFFGSIEGVIEEECQLYTYLAKNNGIILAPDNDSHIKNFLKENKIIVNKWYGSALSLKNQNILYLVLEWRGVEIPTHLFGKHNQQNIAATIALSEMFDITQKNIINAIENYIPTNIRSQILEKRNTTFILDFYNANPSSMQLALESFNHIETTKKKIIILGDMLEMGQHAKAEHETILKQVLNMNIADAFFSGPYFGELSSHYHHFENVDDLVHTLRDYDFNNTLVLIKSSKGILYVHEGFREWLDTY
ncbi:UDP-N-acetylmuramoyl-tripeptide--D-alanyl-D-alanine ligase [Candidatus Nomurabacteria bacterium]|nr:UDP-N-acetylmuramoyl-tripeptide--D-alanyl-D-alanine ligase [Candidatus Nomurabacteria bacterium]